MSTADSGAATLPPRMPRSAAIAGVAFALLYGSAIVILRLSVRGAVTERGDWLDAGAPLVATALHLFAYSGIAFLWFMGVVRTHIGAREDRFMSTVYTGSGFLFIGLSFVAAAATRALLEAFGDPGAQRVVDRAAFAFGSRFAYEMANDYALRMAGVFMISLSTLCLRSGAMPRGMVWATWAVAAILLLGTAQTRWFTLLFPLWVLGVSVYLLRQPAKTGPG